MILKATCPTSPEHQRFETTAHIMQDWVVDANGDFVSEVRNLQVTHPPRPENLWTCTSCGKPATVVRA